MTMLSLLLAYYSYLSLISTFIALIILLISSKSFLKIIKPSSASLLSRSFVVIGFCSSIIFFIKPNTNEKLSISSGASFNVKSQILEKQSKQKIISTTQIQLPASNISKIFILGVIITGFLINLIFYFKNLFRLKKIISNSFVIKKFKRVYVLINDTIQTPMSAFINSRAYIILPFATLHNSKQLYMSLCHEIQHHRQRDTMWIHLYYFWKALFFWNPCIHLAIKRAYQTHELACDEVLIGQKHFSIHEYACCLWEVARKELTQKSILAGTTSILGWGSKSLLTERIIFMKRYQNRNLKLGQFFAIMTFLTVSYFCYGTAQIFRNLPLPEEKIQVLVSKIQKETEFPIEMNERILKQLNLYLGSPAGREYIKGSLQRFELLKPRLMSVFHKRQFSHLPFELFAIPIIESAYENLTEEESNTPARAAGLWQIIPGTGRRLGLKVEADADQRIDIEMSTHAALNLLSALYSILGDWRLALLAYNSGENNVQRAMVEHNTRDPWVLIEKGLRSDKNYLSKAMAAILIMKDPESFLTLYQEPSF